MSKIIEKNNLIRKRKQLKEEHLISEVRHPYIENSDIRLKEICDRNVKGIYGENVPGEIKNRIEWELKAINRTGMAFVILLLKELVEKNKLTKEDFRLRDTSSGSYVLYLCGLNNYNPLEFGLTPYFTFGLEQDECIDVGINVPTSEHSKIIKSCKNLEGVSEAVEIGSFGRTPRGVVYVPEGSKVSDVIPTESEEAFATIKRHNYYIHDKVFYFQGIGASDDMQLVYNLSHRLGISDKDINLDDKEIISLFNSTEILGVLPEKIGGVKYGVLGLPTFKEWRAIKILDDIKINSFEDLVKVIGLIHGIGAWWGNVYKLIKENDVSFNDVISTREDIFEYLLSKGISDKEAFQIADRMRRGGRIKKSDKEMMRLRGVPKWYISSCDEIYYLTSRIQCIDCAFRFWKLAYFKIKYPNEFYEEYFNVYDYGDLNKAVKKGYDEVLAYAEMMSKEEVPDIRNDEVYNEYMYKELGLLVAKEMYERRR